MDLHLGHQISVDEPAPRFAVVQDDDAIGCPSWTTPEVFEKVRLSKQTEEEERGFRRQNRLERRQFLHGHLSENSNDWLSEN
jgi:hypothetical protein